MSGMTDSAAVRRINEQCARYLHKPSGVRYHIAYSIGGLNELHPISGPCKYASDANLANTEIWSKLQ
ncbi:MAG: hypothetical protein Q8P85_10385 [Pseudomonas sp.]|nr:hypothetical protein [Pseudomonas sp.]